MRGMLCVGVLAAVCVASIRASAQDEQQPSRAAVVIGANAASPGRRPLRYAHEDARNTARVLRSVGGFDDEDVHVLLDPDPQAVLGAIDHAVARLSNTSRESMLVFYYSGHADERALYPGGAPLAFDALRRRLEDEALSVRVGIIDTCRGGGWTGTRGLSEAEVFEVSLPLDLSSEGSVLIASSSGLEDAHESEELRGGFFTHHWNAALRGAGDRNGDHMVTLTEAFDYAKRLTIRDTVLRTDTPQHPSYRMNLRGRRDLPLARVARGATVIEVKQERGPLQFVHLETGLIVVELPRGERSARLSLRPGRYLVRTASDDETRAREIHVRANGSTTLREEDLEPVESDALASRGFAPRPVTSSTVPDGMSEIRVALGVRHGETAPGVSLSGNDSEFAGLLQINHGVTDRWQWVIPTLAFAYRGGDQGGVEWIPWGGLTGWGVGFSSIEGFLLTGDLGAGFDLRWWLGPRNSLIAGIGLGSHFKWHSGDEVSNRRAPTTWRGRLALGYSHVIGNAVTLAVGLRYAQSLLFRGEVADDRHEMIARLGLGAVQSLALRSLPLIKVHISDVVSLDGYASVDYNFATESFEETYMLGASFIW